MIEVKLSEPKTNKKDSKQNVVITNSIKISKYNSNKQVKYINGRLLGS